MKLRYTVRKQGVGWVVYDNQTGLTVDGLPYRSEARAKCREYNNSERQARDDQQQSKEETI